MKLHNLIFVAMIVGLILGYGLYTIFDPNSGDSLSSPVWHGYVLWILDLVGPTLFMGILKMIIAPLVLASIITGVTSIPDVRQLGSIGWKTLAYYLITTGIAVGLGLAAVLVIQPGKKESSQKIRTAEESRQQKFREEFTKATGKSVLENSLPRPEYISWLRQKKRNEKGSRGHESKLRAIQSAEGRTPGQIFKEDIIRPLLMNPFSSLSANPPNSLGIIFFALLLGIACTIVGPEAKPVVDFFRGLNAVMMRITHWLMLASPVAIGCIVAKLVAETGPTVFVSLGWYCATVLSGIFVHLMLLLTICSIFGKVRPTTLWAGIRESCMIAFSTRSSAATLPVTLANVTENLKVSPKVANFSLPLGATMNMDGTALYEGVAVIFLIQIYGGLDDVQIIMTPMTTILVFLTAVLASIGAAAVPNAGLVTMVLVATAVNLPIYYIPLIFAVDAVLDMFRTSTNVLGDIVGAVVIDRLVGQSQ